MTRPSRSAAIGVSALMGLLAFFSANPAQAQYPNYTNPSRKPTVSPYINLLRQGSDPGINYYGIVRPEIAARRAIVQLEDQQTTLANQPQEVAVPSALPATGHASGFLTQSKYFMTRGGQGSAAAVVPIVPRSIGPATKTAGVRH